MLKTVSTFGALNSVTFRNRLVNGSFAIDQRNSGAVQTFTAAAAIAYCTDCWYASCTGANVTGQQVTGTGQNQFAYKLTGAASNTGTLFGQRIESFNSYDLINQNVTASLVVSSSTLTSITWTAFYANSTDSFAAKTQIATGTITVSTTPTLRTLNFNAGANAGNGIAIEFTTGALLATQTVQYENVQLEAGSFATPFERIDYSTNLAMCQRYFWKYSTSIQYLHNTAYAFSATQAYAFYQFPVQMRVAPTLQTTGTAADYRLQTNAGSTTLSVVPALNNATPLNANVVWEVAAGLTAGNAILTRFDDEANDVFLAWSAVL
jgi:hypothetical protein